MGKTQLGKSSRTPKTPSKKAKSKKRAAKSASETASRMYAVMSGRSSAKGARRTLSDQDVSNIASYLGRMMAIGSGRTSARYVGEEAKHRGTGPGRKKGGRAKK